MSKITSNSNRAKYTFLILEVLDVKWYADAMRFVERCCEDVRCPLSLVISCRQPGAASHAVPASAGLAGLVILWSVVQSSALCLAVAAGLIDRTAATLFIFDGSTP